MADSPLPEERDQHLVKSFGEAALHQGEAEPLPGIERSNSAELKETVEERPASLDNKINITSESKSALPYSPQLKERLATQTPPSPGRDVFRKAHEPRGQTKEEEQPPAKFKEQEGAVIGEEAITRTTGEQEQTGEWEAQVDLEQKQRQEETASSWTDGVEPDWVPQKRNGRKNKGKKTISESSESDTSEEVSFQTYGARNRERRLLRERRRRSKSKEEEKHKERERGRRERERERERGKEKLASDEKDYFENEKSEERESEELQNEIEKNMRNDQLRVKEQSGKLKKAQEILRRQKEALRLSERENKTLDELLPYTCFGHPESTGSKEEKHVDITSRSSTDEEFCHVIPTNLSIFTSIPQKKQVERRQKEREIRLEIEKLIRYLKLMKVQSVASNQSRRVIAVSGALNIIQVRVACVGMQPLIV